MLKPVPWPFIILTIIIIGAYFGAVIYLAWRRAKHGDRWLGE